MNINEDEKVSIKNEIINLLSDKKAREAIDIIKYLNYPKEYDSLIMKIISEMTDEYDLYMTKHGRYMNFSDSDYSKNYYKGSFISNKEGYGFVRVAGLSEDIFIPYKYTKDAMDGDLVLVHVTKDSTSDRKKEGEIERVLKSFNKYLIAEVKFVKDKCYCFLINSKNNKKLELVGNTKRLVDGDHVNISILGDKANFINRIGHKDDPDEDIKLIIAKHGFNIEFPEEVIEELKSIPTNVLESDLKGREDLRNKMIFTIDGDDTKDIDDAISLEKLSDGNYQLGVHIADVSHYSKEGSAIDMEARTRGTSVYAGNTVNPMHHHQLSNGICSLNPLVDRLAISCIMEIDSKGNVVDYNFFPSVIRSRIQMTYKKVNEILEKGVVPDGYFEYASKLKEMKALADIVRSNKVNRGYIDFNVDEAKIIRDESGKVIDITKRYRGSGEKLIEDFMILANECAASYIYNMGLPGIYRVHGDVSIERLTKFIKLLQNYKIRIKANLKHVNQKLIQDILKEIGKLESSMVLSMQMLSCMDKARYQTKNIGHYALASPCYTHFTSPIRRYPDVMVHRLLKAYFFSGTLSTEVVNHYENILNDICLTSSERERASIEVEREVDDMLMAEYMESRVGEIYEGMISGITEKGIFVILDNLVEGMIRLDSLDERLIYDDENQILVSSKVHKIYTIGTKVTIKVLSASKYTGQIDFSLYDKEKEEDYEKEKVKKS